jgi:energy-converting hydrogenase Eha subunit H
MTILDMFQYTLIAGVVIVGVIGIIIVVRNEDK